MCKFSTIVRWRNDSARAPTCLPQVLKGDLRSGERIFTAFHLAFRQRKFWKLKKMGHGEFLVKRSWFYAELCVHFCCWSCSCPNAAIFVMQMASCANNFSCFGLLNDPFLSIRCAKRRAKEESICVYFWYVLLSRADDLRRPVQPRDAGSQDRKGNAQLVTTG